MNCRCLTFRIYFVLLISSHCVNTGSCRSLLGRNKFIYFLRGSLGVLIRPLLCFGGALVLLASSFHSVVSTLMPFGPWDEIRSFGGPGMKEMKLV